MTKNGNDIARQPGTWIGNVFYSDVLAQRYMANVSARVQHPKLDFTLLTGPLNDIAPHDAAS